MASTKSYAEFSQLVDLLLSLFSEEMGLRSQDGLKSSVKISKCQIPVTQKFLAWGPELQFVLGSQCCYNKDSSHRASGTSSTRDYYGEEARGLYTGIPCI